jgi:hypothetical protein
MIGNNFNSIGFENSHFKQNAGFSKYAINWRSSIITNGGTIPNPTLRIFDDFFFKPAMLNGNILDQLDRLNIYCGLNGYPIAARTNMINNGCGFVTPVNSPTFDNLGYKSVGTGYLNLNYNPKTQGVKFLINSATFFAVVKNPLFTGTKRMLGAFNSTFINQLAMVRNLNNLSTSVNTGGGILNTNTTTGNVFLAGRRTNSTRQDTIINSNIVNAAQISTDIPDLNQFELVVNSNGTPLGPFDDMYHFCSGHGSGNLDITALRTILNNLFARLGV